MTPRESSVALRARELSLKHSLKRSTWFLLRNKAGSLKRRREKAWKVWKAWKAWKAWKQCGEWGGGRTVGELKLRSETVHEARFV